MNLKPLFASISLFAILCYGSCKKSPAYPAGTATVKYEISTSSPIISSSYGGISCTVDSGKTFNDANFSGGSWAKTIIISTKKGNRFPGATLIEMYLLADVALQQPGTIDAKIYVNGELKEHSVSSSTIVNGPPGESNYASVDLTWSTNAAEGFQVSKKNIFDFKS